MSFAYQISVGPFQPHCPALRSQRYLKFIRSMACAVCASHRNVEAAHTGPHGTAIKAADRDAIPLCAKHHRLDTFSLEKQGPAIFSEMHRLHIPDLIAKFNRLYDERIVRKRRK